MASVVDQMAPKEDVLPSFYNREWTYFDMEEEKKKNPKILVNSFEGDYKRLT
jgi:hypothetical protein